MKPVPLDQISYESLARLVNTSFRAWAGSETALDLKLCEISARQVSTTGGKNPLAYEHFALVFLGPAERLLPQQIYWLESAGLGRFELFIVPVGRDASGVRYEATFNRLTPPV